MDALTSNLDINSNKQLRFALGQISSIVSTVRPKPWALVESANNNIQTMIEDLSSDKELLNEASQALSLIFEKMSLTGALVNSGILSDTGFFSETFKRLEYKLLPPLMDIADVRFAINHIFRNADDFVWVEVVEYAHWQKLISLFVTIDFKISETTRYQIIKSLEILSLRVASQAQESVIHDKLKLSGAHPQVFVDQCRLIQQSLMALDRQASNFSTAPISEIEEKLKLCLGALEKLREHKNKFGVSLSLTYRLLRLKQSIERLQDLISLLATSKKERQLHIVTKLLIDLVRSENQKYNLRGHISSNLELLAYQITEHAGRAGEHYITQSTEEYWEMFHSALKGGAIVGVLVLIKVLISYLPFAPALQAVSYSLNYGIGFIIIHLAHATLATKQPAMTASKIAASMDNAENSKKVLVSLNQLIVKTFRSQMIAVFGNFIIALPVGIIIGVMWAQLFKKPVINVAKSFDIFLSLNPFHSLSLFYAAQAGVCLFLCGLIAGYFENWFIYHRIYERLVRHSLLKRVFGEIKLKKIVEYIKIHIGALSGNFILGCFLGTLPIIGYITGLPLDIRHITFSSGQLGLSLVTIFRELSGLQIFMGLIGVLMIGLVNLGVSFSLALLVAMKSRHINFTQGRHLLTLLWKYFLTRPRDFFLPPKSEK